MGADRGREQRDGGGERKGGLGVGERERGGDDCEKGEIGPTNSINYSSRPPCTDAVVQDQASGSPEVLPDGLVMGDVFEGG